MEVGEEVTRLKVGDRVALEPGVPCWSNPACRCAHVFRGEPAKPEVRCCYASLMLCLVGSNGQRSCSSYVCCQYWAFYLLIRASAFVDVKLNCLCCAGKDGIISTQTSASLPRRPTMAP